MSNDNLKDKIDGAADKAKDVADKAGAGIKHGTEKVADTAKDVADKAGAGIKHGAEKVADTAHDVADKVKDVGSDIGKKVGG